MTDTSADALKVLDSQLLHWLLDNALPTWWYNGADHVSGGFFETLGLTGNPLPQARRARVQARQSYVYSIAGTMNWSGPWREAASHGLKYLAEHYRHPSGAFCTLVSHDGEIVDPTVTVYDQAFALLAMAHASRVLDEPEWEVEALRLVDGILASRRNAFGGFTEAGPRPFQSNPHMHLLEASLAWCAVSSHQRWRDLGDEIVELCLARFIDPEEGFLREFFSEDWLLPSNREERIIEPGHQFEWAWLLEQWGRDRGNVDALREARRLYKAGLRGIDERRGVAIDELAESFQATRATARLWPQTEWMKAALLLAERSERTARSELISHATKAAHALTSYLDTPVEGLWRDKMTFSGDFVEEPSPASSFYHIICGIQCLHHAVGSLRA